MYDKNCHGCKISKGEKIPSGDIVKLDGGWVLNHYDGSDSFLGRLALQSERHCMDLADLELKEAEALGVNIQRVDEALRDYWSEHYRDDYIERTYIVYFFESAFNEEEKEKYHLHIHLIPRTKKLGMDRKGEYKPWETAAWKTYRLPYRICFPDEYRTKDKSGHDINSEKVKALMQFLRGRLAKKPQFKR